MDDFALTPAKRRVLEALNQRGVRYLVILHLWLERPGDGAVRVAAGDAGGFWITAFGLHPPGFGGDGLERMGVVLTAHGLESFDVEYAGALDNVIDGIPVKVLPLERVIVSKRSTNRPKDIAALPALEATLRARNNITDT